MCLGRHWFDPSPKGRTRFIPLTPGLLDQAVDLLVHNDRRDLRAGSDGPGSNVPFEARHYGRIPTGRGQLDMQMRRLSSRAEVIRALRCRPVQ